MLARCQKNIYVVVLFALVLSVMELGLLTHEVSHIQDYTSQSNPDKNTTAGHCQQCISYAHADSAMVQPPLILSLVVIPQSVTKIVVALLASALKPTYRARAPPFFA